MRRLRPGVHCTALHSSFAVPIYPETAHHQGGKHPNSRLFWCSSRKRTRDKREYRAVVSVAVQCARQGGSVGAAYAAVLACALQRENSAKSHARKHIPATKCTQRTRGFLSVIQGGD
eukprot:3583280-Rhodomonas_salina.1